MTVAYCVVMTSKDKERLESSHLWLHASDAHEVSSSKQIEDLVVTAHLDIRLDDHGVIRLEYGAKYVYVAAAIIALILGAIFGGIG